MSLPLSYDVFAWLLSSHWYYHIVGALSTFLFLSVWRLWMFTLKPWLWPHEPKVIPYWIPFVGHAWSFFSNSDRLMERGLKHVGLAREPFAIQVMGNKIYIITAPEDVAATYRDPNLGFDGHVNAVLTNFGFTREGLKHAWGKSGRVIQPISFIHASESNFRKQLLPGEKMDHMCSVFLKALHETLQLPQIEELFKARKDNGRPQLSLYSLCRFAMVDAAIRSLFGRHLHDIDHDIVGQMIAFNDDAWQIFFRLPTFFGLSVTKPRARLCNVLTTFAKLAEDERPDQSWLIRTILADAELIGLDMESRSSMLLLILWAANSNEYNIAFWVLARLLYNDELSLLVRQETETAWQESGCLDIKSLVANCPHLDSVFYESLRLNGGAMVSRVVLSNTIIGGKLLKPDTCILMPSRQLHTNEAVWGPGSAMGFDAQRFLNNRGLVRSSSFRPFGGGATYCPGRMLAKEEVYGFIAILLHRFDMTIVPAQGNDGERPPFPVLDNTTPGLGITGPLKTTNVIVEMKDIA